MKKIAVMGIAALVAASSWAVPGTIKPASGEAQKGDIKWNSRSRTYSIEIKKGAGTASAEHSIDAIESLDIVKPASFDKLVEMVEKGQGASAERGLSDIVKNYKMLVWDRPAASALITVYVQTKRAQKAYELGQTLIAEDKTAAYKGAMAPSYWQALLDLNKKLPLENCLKLAATQGDRVSSAEATLMRGDIIMHDGAGTPEACRKALKDSYLRVALMYNDKPCVAQRRKAMLKCAEAFEKLGDAEKAQRMRSDAAQLAN